MTNEEIQRVMEFIVKRQESFAEGMEQMRSQTEKRLNVLERAAVNLYNVTAELAKSQKVLTEKMAELAEAQTHTDQRVNALIDILAQGRNGKSEDKP